MKKIAALLLCFCMLSLSSLSAFAQAVTQDEEQKGATVSVTVPDSHTLTVNADNAHVFYNGQSADNFDIERLSEPMILIRPENGYRVTKVTLNGEDITDEVIGGYYTLDSVYEEKMLEIETAEVTSNSDSTHDISGTITDENGNPIPGATVDIGGQTATTDEDGNFVIENVPDGFHTVTVTDENGNIIGYTEVEIGEGEVGVTQNPDGSYTLTAPENADLSLGMTLTEDGRLTIDNVEDVTVTTPDTPFGGSSPQTGDEINIILLAILLAAGMPCVAFAAVRNRKQM